MTTRINPHCVLCKIPFDYVEEGIQKERGHYTITKDDGVVVQYCCTCWFDSGEAMKFALKRQEEYKNGKS